MGQETLYTTIAIIDRYLQVEIPRNVVSRSKLQLVGVAAMLIAAKYEEIYAPEVKDFVYITDRAYTEKEILKMEIKILSTLSFDLGRPLPLHFLRRASKAGGVEAITHTRKVHYGTVAGLVHHGVGVPQHVGLLRPGPGHQDPGPRLQDVQRLEQDPVPLHQVQHRSVVAHGEGPGHAPDHGPPGQAGHRLPEVQQQKVHEDRQNSIIRRVSSQEDRE